MTYTDIQPARRILVIDDNRAIHSDFRRILTAPAGERELDEAGAELFGDAPPPCAAVHFELDSAYQGQEGLERVRQAAKEGRPYALAFVDVRMPPGWDGIETTARLWEVCPEMQIVICTAFSDYSWDEMIAKIGQSDHLVILRKPFDNVEVQQLASALTEKWRLFQQTRQQVSDLEDRVIRRTEELRKSEERFRLITENAVDLISIVDARGLQSYSSPSYEKLLGYTPDDLGLASAFDHVHPDDRARVAAVVQQTRETGLGQVVEYRVRVRDGTWRTLEAHGAPFRNAAGIVEGVLLVARDMTERKMLEVQLRQAQKLESIGQLAAGIAHEINTPTQFIGDNTRFVRDAFNDLQNLFAASDRLLQAARAQTITAGLIAEVEAARQQADLDYLMTEVPKALNQTIDGIERVTRIVRAMKEFSHPGTEHKTLLDLNQAIESTATVCRNEWKYVAELVTDFDPSLPPVPVLPGEFNQVVLNLIINASHAIADVVGKGSKTKGTITASTRREGDWVEVRIRDTGTGIPVKARDHIFDPFFTTKGVGKGTGQGLAIARSVVVDKHGGTISFETELGQGTCLIIRLPLAEPAAQEQAA